MIYKVNENAKRYKDNGFKILTVILPMTGETSHTKFWLSFIELFSAENIWTLEAEHKIKVIIHREPNFPIDFNRNHSLDLALHAYLSDYIFMMDTDMTFPKDCVFQLMKHLSDEYPVTVGMYYKKGSPYRCVHGVFAENGFDKEKAWPELESQGLVKDGKQYLYLRNINWFSKDKPFEVNAIGAGCILAKREAFLKIKQPYFKYTYNPLEVDPYLLNSSEDIWFSAQLAMNGVKILCVPQVQCGHITTQVIDQWHMETYRDQSLELLKKSNFKRYEEVMKDTIDVRANGVSSH